MRLPLNTLSFSKPVEEASLSRKAGLTFASSFAQQILKVLLAFIVTPILISGLGRTLYGAWLMIQQILGYLAFADLRPMSALKFWLSVNQHKPESEEKRKTIGAAMLLWAFALPIFLILCSVIVWLSPVLIPSEPDVSAIVRLALIIALVTTFIDRLFSLPGNVLRGQNLDYMAFVQNVITVILSSVLAVVAVIYGFGLPGVAFSTLVTSVVSGLLLFIVARRVIPWFGASLPSRPEFFEFCRLSWWLFFSAVASLLLLATDIYLAGLLFTSSMAAIYAMTGAVLRLLQQPMSQLWFSGGPGVAKLCGEKNWERLSQVRQEMHQLTLSTMTLTGVGVILLNESFLHLWLGPGLYGGHLLNMFLVLNALALSFYRIDGLIVDCLLDYKLRAGAHFFCGLLAVALSCLLAPRIGPAGIALGGLIALVLLNAYFPFLIRKRTGIRINSMRSLVTVSTLSLLAAAALSRLMPVINSWPVFLVYAIITAIIMAFILWKTITPQARTAAVTRINAIIKRGSA